MRIVQEMYARGFDFLPMDIYKARARHFQVMGNKLMPSINSIDGLGEKAADSIEEAAKDGPFLSKEDFRNRTRVIKTICDPWRNPGSLRTFRRPTSFPCSISNGCPSAGSCEKKLRSLLDRNIQK